MCEIKIICKNCLVEKENKDFYYIKKEQKFTLECKNCLKEKLKSKRELKSGRREDSNFINQKYCIRCNKLKDINRTNFFRTGGAFSKICKDCLNENRVTKTCNKGPLDESTLKTCSRCKEEKEICNFYYSISTKKYVSACKTCESIRKKRKTILKPRVYKIKVSNKSSELLRNYINTDRNRNRICDLDKDFIKYSLENPCTYCGFPSTGLDRINNNLGHTKSNCIPCCKECNIARNNNFTYEEMIELGLAIKIIKSKRININKNEF